MVRIIEIKYLLYYNFFWHTHFLCRNRDLLDFEIYSPMMVHNIFLGIL